MPRLRRSNVFFSYPIASALGYRCFARFAGWFLANRPATFLGDGVESFSATSKVMPGNLYCDVSENFSAASKVVS